MKRLTASKVHIINLIALALGGVTALIGALTDITAVCIIGIVIMLGSIIFRFMFYNCPHCGKYLDRGVVKYCPNCGKDVNQ